MRNAPHRSRCLNTWSPIGGTSWGDDGTFRRWSLALGDGGSESLRVGLEG